MLKLEVLFNRIIVKRDEAEEVTKSGIVIPSKAKEDKLFGTVEAVGTDVKYLKLGDHILFEKYGGDDIVIDDIKYILMNEDVVIGIVK